MSLRLLSSRMLAVAGVLLLASSVRAQDKMYWVEKSGDVIGFADRDGTNAGSFAIGSGSASQGLAVDALNGHVYWSELLGNTIRRANLDGSNTVDIVTGIDALSLTLDVYRQKIYWVESDSTNDLTKVRRANLDGTSVENVVATAPANFPLGIALDVKNDKIYWTEVFAQSVSRANLDGSSIEVIATSQGSVGAIAVDTTNDKVYWTACFGDISSANLDGSNVQAVLPNALQFSCSAGLVLDVPNGKLYWSDEAGLVSRANLDGSVVEALIPSGLAVPEQLALDELPEVPASIPAASTWGLAEFALLLCIVGTLALQRRQPLLRT